MENATWQLAYVYFKEQNWPYINLELFTNWAESIHPFRKKKKANKIINHYDTNTMVM